MEEKNEEEALCLKCGRKVPYKIEYTDGPVLVDGCEVSCRTEKAVCPECGSEVWVGSVSDRNVRRARDAYCREKGLMTPDDVKALTEKYGISAKLLSRLLGWKDGTIKGFIDGGIPSRRRSKKLSALMEDEDRFRRLFDRRKKRILYEMYKEDVEKVVDVPDEKTAGKSIAEFDGCVRAIARSLSETDPTNELSVHNYSDLEKAARTAKENGSVVIDMNEGEESSYVLTALSKERDRVS